MPVLSYNYHHFKHVHVGESPILRGSTFQTVGAKYGKRAFTKFGGKSRGTSRKS